MEKYCPEITVESTFVRCCQVHNNGFQMCNKNTKFHKFPILKLQKALKDLLQNLMVLRRTVVTVDYQNEYKFLK